MGLSSHAYRQTMADIFGFIGDFSPFFFVSKTPKTLILLTKWKCPFQDNSISQIGCLLQTLTIHCPNDFRFLAHDMEEDDEEIKQEIFPWALGRRWKSTYPSLIARRDDMLQKMNFRSVVSNVTCLEVSGKKFSEPFLWFLLRLKSSTQRNARLFRSKSIRKVDLREHYEHRGTCC